METSALSKNYVLFTNQFKSEMYIGNDYLLTDNKNDALKFDAEFDNKIIKKEYYSSVSGLKLEIVFI